MATSKKRIIAIIASIAMLFSVVAFTQIGAGSKPPAPKNPNIKVIKDNKYTTTTSAYWNKVNLKGVTYQVEYNSTIRGPKKYSTSKTYKTVEAVKEKSDYCIKVRVRAKWKGTYSNWSGWSNYVTIKKKK